MGRALDLEPEREFDRGAVRRHPGDLRGGRGPRTRRAVHRRHRPHGLVGRYEDVGCHAIGSGSAMAQQAGALLAHFSMTERDVDHGVLAAVRVLDALRITAPSVGGPIDVHRLTADGAHALSEEDLERVRERVRRWAELEDEALDQLPRS